MFFDSSYKEEFENIDLHAIMRKTITGMYTGTTSDTVTLSGCYFGILKTSAYLCGCFGGMVHLKGLEPSRRGH